MTSKSRARSAVFAVVVATLGLAGAAQAQGGACPTVLAGRWDGAYTQGGGTVPFQAQVRQTGGRLFGDIHEPNTFGDTRQALFLTAVFEGSKTGCAVQFTKTYTGRGGVSHSVRYSGALNAAGTVIAGVYDNGAGRFEMVRPRP